MVGTARTASAPWTPQTELPELSGTVRHFTVLKEGGDQTVAAKPAQAHQITWDKYSLKVDGQRVFSWGGEFHPFRVPSPDLWRDILQKMKASGYNTVAFYFDWGFHRPNRASTTSTACATWTGVLTMAKEEGLWVITRAGPYVNAELTRGGYPGWLVNQRGARPHRRSGIPGRRRRVADQDQRRSSPATS